jgi:ankyrin repeat protein
MNYQNQNGFTPLHAATTNDHLNVTKVLIEARCNVNATSRLGRTPIMTVIQKGVSAMAKLLIEARCNVNQQQYDGDTPLYMAAFFGHLQITEQLIEARTNLDHGHRGERNVHLRGVQFEMLSLAYGGGKKR